VIMMNALLDLLALMPILPVHIAKYLQEIFEVFRSFENLIFNELFFFFFLPCLTLINLKKCSLVFDLNF
jgi:hypothetical protein